MELKPFKVPIERLGKEKGQTSALSVFLVYVIFYKIHLALLMVNFIYRKIAIIPVQFLYILTNLAL